MYQFRIVKQLGGGYKFELGEIKMFIDDYNVVDNRHHLNNPGKAIAYFNTEDSIYGVSNEPYKYDTAEAFFDAVTQQYKIFKDSDVTTQRTNNNGRQHFA